MFGRFTKRKRKRIDELALETRAALAAPTDADKAPRRDALHPPRSRGGLALALREQPLATRVSDDVDTVARTAEDTMIVASPASWYVYQRTAAFICEPGRAFRPVRYLAYAVDGTLQREVPRIIAVRDDVPFDSTEQRRLMWSATELDLRLADVIATVRRLGLAGERHQVYLLTAPGQAGHVTLPPDVVKRASRRGLLARLLGSRHRYVSAGRLRLGRAR